MFDLSVVSCQIQKTVHCIVHGHTHVQIEPICQDAFIQYPTKVLLWCHLIKQKLISTQLAKLTSRLFNWEVIILATRLKCMTILSKNGWVCRTSRTSSDLWVRTQSASVSIWGSSFSIFTKCSSLRLSMLRTPRIKRRVALSLSYESSTCNIFKPRSLSSSIWSNTL